ncbi:MULTISPECIES: hypothetical protein [unclassified Novosphingobium]|uniref:hypothetical protein n=1 Tax=unclassified Novosphingobium TaxID=2644732 RepID=UPI00146ACA70|nr:MULTISPECIES: hypothetical protein [unclassified Novosphingobium]NMN06721.1 hypothetical protein [Novosphingobium sp. SG919]NMN88828.1 hypothetical protein [Novosphingobium sp. SG916]
MKIRLQTLKLLCRQSEEVLTFSRNITFIHGTLSLGKSTVVRLIDFCLGGNLEMTTAIQREFLAAALTLQVRDLEVLIERSRGEGFVRVSWMDPEEGPVSLQVRAKGDGPVVFGTDVVNLSDLLFRLLGYPIIRVRKRTGDEDSPMVRLSFRDLFKFCYLEQEELDSSFFRLNTPVLAEKSKDSLNFFTGYYSEVLSTLQIQYDQTRTEQRAKRDAAERIREFLREFDFASVGQIATELQKVRGRADELRRLLSDDNAAYLSDTHFVDDQRVELRHLSDLLERERETLEDLNFRLNEQRELRSELLSMKFKVARADRARAVLAGSAFENCPQCGQPISTHRSHGDDCYLCLQPLLPDESAITPATINSDLDARLADIEASLRRHGIAKKRQEVRIAAVLADKNLLDRRVADLLATYESDRLARTRDAQRELAELDERARFLDRVSAMPDAVTKMVEDADALSADLERLEREIIAEQRRLSKADANFAALEENFLEALVATHVPGVSSTDEVHINRRTMIPEIWPGGDEAAAYSFYTAGSGGKKTLLTICFALALHRTAAEHDLPVPTLLMIDTPLKNITPDINPELVQAFYRYLYEVAESDLSDHQVIIVDQLLVEPPEDSALEFTDRLMTEDDPENPPLISYYHGP